MIDLSLLSPTIPVSSPADLIPSSLTPTNTSASVLTRSRRPAILTYASPIIDTASMLSGLPWYMLGWKKESEVLEVSMFEGVEFSKGWKNIPDMVKVLVEADEKMQFYEVGVKIIARFGGLRYDSLRKTHFVGSPAYSVIQIHSLQLSNPILRLFHHVFLPGLNHIYISSIRYPLILFYSFFFIVKY